jgi:hypothetical protein
MMKLLLVVLLVACGGGKPTPRSGYVDTAAPVGGIVPANEIGLQISDGEGTRVMRLLPSGKIVVHDQATGNMTAGGEIKNAEGTLVAVLGPDGTVEIPTFSYTGFKIDAAGTLIQDGQPVAKFAADNTLETKLDSVRCYASQFDKERFAYLEHYVRSWAGAEGASTGVKYGELYTLPRPLGVADMASLFGEWKVPSPLRGVAKTE